MFLIWGLHENQSRSPWLRFGLLKCPRTILVRNGFRGSGTPSASKAHLGMLAGGLLTFLDPHFFKSKSIGKKMSELINKFQSVLESASQARQEIEAKYQETVKEAVKRVRKKQREIRVMYSMLNGNSPDNMIGGLA